MRKQIPTIQQTMPAGIFQAIASLGVTIPWTQANNLLDIDYLYRWSGNKPISPLIKQLCGNSETLPDNQYAIVAGVIWANYGDKWTRIYDTLTTKYAPLENYDMTEHYEGSRTDDATTRDTASPSNNVIRSQTDADIYGYNSSSPAPSDKSVTETTQGKDATSKYDNETGEEHELRRHGNIGVTTSQQMAESEIALRQYNFFEGVYKDLDKILALPIYDADYNDSIYSGGGGGTGMSVISVNGKTGNVTLYASDIDISSMISQTVSEAIRNLNNEKRNKPVVINTTLPANQTTISVTNDAIGDNSTINIYVNKSGVSFTGWTQIGNVFTMSFDPFASDILITLEVYNG